MTTLYRPVPITSAEQARRLPDGSILVDRDASVCFERSGDDWHDPDGFGVEICMNVGARPVALVPIEAEEEWTAMGSDNGEPWVAHVGHDGIDGSREEAQQYVDRFGGFIAHRTRTPWEETP